MPEVHADLFLSLDGHAAGSRSPGYFGFDGPELQQWIRTEMDRRHVTLMGRRTYTLLSSLPEEARDEDWRRMTEAPTIVFSRTLGATDWPGASVDASDAVGEVARLRTAAGPDLRTVGSLSLVRQLLDAGLVDRLRLMLFPLIVAQTGREPFFSPLADTALELVAQTIIDGRVVLLEYRPAGTPPYVS